MTSHGRESQGHRWHDRHAYGTVSLVHILVSHTHSQVINTVKVFYTALKIAISLSPNLFADIRIIRMFCVHILFPSAESTRNPLCYIRGCFDYMSCECVIKQWCNTEETLCPSVQKIEVSQITWGFWLFFTGTYKPGNYYNAYGYSLLAHLSRTLFHSKCDTVLFTGSTHQTTHLLYFPWI